ncbi:MAG: prolipoprotein diacylglyceryl transferase, partial [Anaerolineales bacterium]
PHAFFDNPIDLVSPNPHLFDPYAGLVVGIITALVYIQRNNLSFWHMLDALTPAFATVSIALSLSNYASGNAFGSPTTLPWGINLWGTTRHPTQIYEALGAGIIFWLLWPGHTMGISKPGTLFLRFVAYTATIRLFLEAFRGDSLVTIYNLRVVQITAWIILAISLWGWYSLIHGKGKTRENPVK